jgi:hypothetical protein
LRAGQPITNRWPYSPRRQQKPRRACQSHRPSYHNLSVFETVYGRPELIYSAYFNRAGQRIFIYTLLFKFGAVVSKPAHNPICILFYFRFLSIWHSQLLYLNLIYAQASKLKQNTINHLK